MAPDAPVIHVISLARTPGRLAQFGRDNAGVAAWTVFPAIDGVNVPPRDRDALGDTALWSRGGAGAALSHIALWRLCVAQGRPITVCEDDAVLRGDFAAASAALLGAAADFDIVLWGWNFDAVLRAEFVPGVPTSLMVDQAAFRAAVDAFRDDRRPSAPARLTAALGMCCYTVSPKGAAALLAALPVGDTRLVLPFTPLIENVTFDVHLANVYSRLDARVALPPLAATRNDWAVSAIRNPEHALEPAAATARAETLAAAGRADEALATLQAAVVAAPGELTLWASLGQRLSASGLQAAAAAALLRARRLDPAHGVVAYNLARVRLVQGRMADALALLEEVCAARADFAEAHSNRGVALLGLGRAGEARDAFRLAVGRAPALIEAHRGLAAAARALHDPAGAATALETVLGLEPADEAARDALGAARLELAQAAQARGDLGEALRLAERARAAPAHRLHAAVIQADLLERLGRFEDAFAAAGAALEVDPRSPHALNNLGVAHLRLGRPVQAEATYRRALAIAPDLADAHHGLAFALLKQGRWAEGWPEYEWRLEHAATRPWAEGFGRPRWRGEAAPDATLLLAAEQGLGDTLQAACLIAELRERVGRVLVQAPAALTRLLARIPGVDGVIPDGAPRPPFHLWAPLMSLPGLLAIAPDRRPPDVSPLQADPALAAAWAERLPPGRPRIGVAWQGNPTARVEHGRSFPLAALRPLVDAGAALVSLQKGAGLEQLAAQPPGPAVVDLGAAYQDGDFEDTAAIMAGLDLVVSCDTAVIHLAGALGRPAWLALGTNPDWRWPDTVPANPWYASVTLFRRGGEDGWPAVFHRMAERLPSLFTPQKKHVRARRRPHETF